MSAATSGIGRFQLSLENAYSVRVPIAGVRSGLDEALDGRGARLVSRRSGKPAPFGPPTVAIHNDGCV